MSILDVLRAGIKVADTIVKPLEATVMFKRFNTVDGFGSKLYYGTVNLKAVVEWKQQQLRTMSGELTVSRASILFLDIAALVKATGGEGVDDNDIITLPDGTTGPILDMTGFIDAGTGHPIATEVFLG